MNHNSHCKIMDCQITFDYKLFRIYIALHFQNAWPPQIPFHRLMSVWCS